MTDQTAIASGPHSSFGMSGGLPDVMAMASARVQAISDAASAMFRDASEAPFRIHQAVMLLTDNGDVGPIGTVLGAAAGWLAATVLVTVLVRRILRPARLRLRHAGSTSSGRVAVHILEALLVDLAPLAAYLLVGIALGRLLFGKQGLLFAGTDTFHAIFSAFVVNSSVAWLAIIVAAIPLAAKRSGLRLLPLGDHGAREIQRFVRIVIVIGAASWLLAEGLYLAWFGDGVPRLILLTAAVVIGILCLRALSRMELRTHFERVWHVLAIFSVFGLILTWAHGLLLDVAPPIGRVLGALAVLAAMPLVDGMIRLLLGRVRRHLAHVVAPPRTIYIPAVDGDVEALPAGREAARGCRARLRRRRDGALARCADRASCTMPVDTVLAIAAGAAPRPRSGRSISSGCSARARCAASSARWSMPASRC